MEGVDEQVKTPLRPVRRFRHLQIVLIGVVLILFLALVGLWVARKPLASDVIHRELARRGVPARYQVADLGFGRQRLTNVVIGDPRAPDLVADWLETRTRLTLSGPAVTGIRAGKVRLRARLVGGQLRLGALDRLMPPSSGKPFALPRLNVDIADGGIHLDTPNGMVGISLSGAGRLNDGFAGRLGLVAPQLAQGDCVARGVAAPMRVRIVRERPTLTGPVRVAGLRCGGVALGHVAARLDLTLGAALDRWEGRATLDDGAIRHSLVQVGATRGEVEFSGNARATQGRLRLTALQVAARQGQAERLAVQGRYLIGPALRFDGQMRVGGGRLSAPLAARLKGWSASAAGMPVAPVARRIEAAVTRAGQRFVAEMDIAVDRETMARGGGVTIRVPRLAMASASGGRLALAGGSGLVRDARGIRLDTQIASQGGDLPHIRATLRQDGPGKPMRGTADMARYNADGASLALDQLVFQAGASGETQVTTRLSLSGPIGGGRVDGLVLPVAARWNGGRQWRINPTCQPLAIARLAISGLRLDRVATTLCPLDGALVRIDGPRIGGAVQLGATRLSGRIGSSPLTLSAAATRFTLADRRFALTGVESRIGHPEAPTRIDARTLIGQVTAEGLKGQFSGGGGQVGQVPLLLDQAEGDWQLARGILALNGALRVSDARADSPRFLPMAARNVGMTLVNSQIHATGALFEPTKNGKVADLVIDHALDKGAGSAELAVPGIAFSKNFQPELLTPVTFGVIADVQGTVSGRGRIDWDAQGVRSTGRFRTDGVDLAAASGPVTGIAGTINFTDLLALESAPHQEVTIRTFNPGIQVTNGIVHYQTLSGTRVRVEDGRWPFADGELTLAPTLLDFSQPVERRMTFRVKGAAADQFLMQFDFQNLNATGVFDGTLPIVFDERGGRIEGGQLVVRNGGGSIAYLGEISQKNLGFWGNLAFGALRSLNYRSLQIDMNGPLAGEMITDVRFAGISQGKGATSNYIIRRLQKLPFVFNVRIKAPFRGLIDSAQSFYDPRRLIQRNLPALLDEQNKRAAPPAAPSSTTPSPTPIPAGQPPIQHSASETVP